MARPLLTVFTVALVVRCATVVLLNTALGGFSFLDDTTYADMAAQMAAGETDGWGRYTHWLYWRTSAFLLPVTGLFWLFGASAVVGQFYVALLGACVAVGVTYLALAALSSSLAMTAGFAVAVLPSQVLWSALVLKDATVWLAVTAVAIILARVPTQPARKMVLWTVLLTLALVSLFYVRQHTFVVAVLATTIAVPLIGIPRSTVGAGVVVAGVLPLVLGLGPFGLEFVRDAGSLEVRRHANAEDAETAFVVPDQPEVNGQPASLISDLRHLPRGLSVMLLEPYPWQRTGNARLRFAQLESVVWYPLLAFGVIGTRDLWRHKRVLLFPLLFGGGTVILYSLTEGNFGTAYRHRGEFVWVVALFAAFGVRRLADRYGTVPTDAGSKP